MKIRTLPLVITFFLASTLLIGCATKETSIMLINDSSENNLTAEKKLAESAESVSQSLQELAKIERASHPKAKIPQPLDPEMIGMAQLATMDCTAPIGSVLKKIAKAARYKVKTLGNPPAIPIIVSISAKDVPLADILRDAGFQCGKKANITIFPATRIIEIQYKKI